jgi:uncharacterized protein YecE (DUF72 family)
VGCSGWEYADWTGTVYPRGSKVDHLAHYARLFPVVEVNSTFYHLPRRASVESWRRRTPSEFRFAAKFSRAISHRADATDVERLLRLFYDAFRPMIDEGRSLAFLLQMPPSRAFRPDAARALFEALPEQPPVAAEFRHESWFSAEADDLLRTLGIASTAVDSPRFPVRLAVTSPRLAYVRWHGRGPRGGHDYRYTPEELAAWIPRIRELEARAELVLGFFNNDIGAAAPRNALEFRRLLGEPVRRAVLEWAARFDRGEDAPSESTDPTPRRGGGTDAARRRSAEARLTPARAAPRAAGRRSACGTWRPWGR